MKKLIQLILLIVFSFTFLHSSPYSGFTKKEHNFDSSDDGKRIDTIALPIIANDKKSNPEFYIKVVNDACVTTYIHGVEIDTIIFDFGQIKSGEHKHAVIFLKSLNKPPFSYLPNSDGFINFDYKAILSYFPTKTNPLTEESKGILPYRFYKEGNSNILQTTSSKPLKMVDSAYFNIVLFNFNGYDYEKDSIYHKISENLGGKQTILIFKAKLIYGYNRELTWKDDLGFRARYYNNNRATLLTLLPPRTHIDDFNRDGITDTLLIHISSRYYPKTFISGATFLNGATHNTFYFSYPYDTERDGSFLFFDRMDEELCTPANMRIVKMMRDTLFKKKDRWIGPSLDWLLRYLKAESTQIDSPFYDMTTVKPNWFSWPPSFPKSYYVWYEFDSTLKSDFYVSIGKGWLFYLGGYHTIYNRESHKYEKWFHQVTENENYKIYKTAHGIIARKGDKYCWIYHDNECGKLRWNSIWGVTLYHNYVIALSCLLGECSHFMINIETGVMKWPDLSKLGPTSDCCRTKHMSVHNGELIIKCYDPSGKCQTEEGAKIKLYHLIKEFEK